MAQCRPGGVVIVVRDRPFRFAVARIEIRGCLPGKGVHAMADGGEVSDAAARAVEVFLLLPLRITKRGDRITRFDCVSARGDDA
ncbi:hypothetical protein GCM10027404_16370 [Arthrobacter tumbae]